MKNVFAQTFPSGDLVVDVKSITLVNNTAKNQDVTVPDDTVYILQSIKITNPDDVNRNVSVNIYKEAALTNHIKSIMDATVNASARHQLPNDSPTADVDQQSDIKGDILVAGNTIRVTWAAGGASTGGTDADGLVLVYRRLTLT